MVSPAPPIRGKKDSDWYNFILTCFQRWLTLWQCLSTSFFDLVFYRGSKGRLGRCSPCHACPAQAGVNSLKCPHCPVSALTASTIQIQTRVSVPSVSSSSSRSRSTYCDDDYLIDSFQMNAEWPHCENTLLFWRELDYNEPGVQCFVSV